MSRVYKPLVYKPLPAGAELFMRRGQRFAKWTDKRGRTRTGVVAVPKRGKHAGTPRLVVESSRYIAQYRNAEGVQTVSTGCRDESAARGVLRELERRAELVKGNLLTAAEARTGDFQAAPLAEHFAAFETYLSTRASSAMHRTNVMSRLRRLAAECGFAKLADLDRGKLEAWLAAAPESMAARTRNGYVSALTSFCNWAVNAGRLSANPFARFHRANERTDQRRPRRAMTAAELTLLIEAARRRPLAEHGRYVVRVRAKDEKGPRRGSWTYAPVTAAELAECEARAEERLARKHPERIAEAKAEGRLRALTYKTLVLTGLRLNELRTLTVAQANLDGPAPYVTLRAADDKARRGAEIALRADLAADLSEHLAERLREAQRAAKAASRPIPARLPAGAPLLEVPAGLVKRFDRDLIAAGIAGVEFDKAARRWRIDKRDALGRTLDVHCLRHSFNSLLAAAGVPLTTRQILMRHTAQTVTDGRYTDVTLIDLRGALDKLPPLRLDPSRPDAERLRATGTGGKAYADARSTVCRAVYSPADESGTRRVTLDESSRSTMQAPTAASDAADDACDSLTSVGQLRAQGLEPWTHGLKGRCSTD